MLVLLSLLGYDFVFRLCPDLESDRSHSTTKIWRWKEHLRTTRAVRFVVVVVRGVAWFATPLIT